MAPTDSHCWYWSLLARRRGYHLSKHSTSFDHSNTNQLLLFPCQLCISKSGNRWEQCSLTGTTEFFGVDSSAMSVLLSDRLLIDLLISTLADGLSGCADSFSVIFSIPVSATDLCAFKNNYSLNRVLQKNMKHVSKLYLYLNVNLYLMSYFFELKLNCRTAETHQESPTRMPSRCRARRVAQDVILPSQPR